MEERVNFFSKRQTFRRQHKLELEVKLKLVLRKVENMGKGGIAVNQHFPFSHNVFNSLLFQRCCKLGQCDKELTNCRRLEMSKLKAFAERKSRVA